MFKRVYACMSCVAMLMSAPSMAGAQAREATLSEVTVRGTVQAIDHTARTVTVQGEGGNVVTLDVPTTATRFDQVKVGDIVAMTYDRVSVRAKPADEAAVNRVLEPTTTTRTRASSRCDSRSSARGDDDSDGRGSDHSVGDLLRAQGERLCTVRDRYGRPRGPRESQGR